MPPPFCTYTTFLLLAIVCLGHLGQLVRVAATTAVVESDGYATDRHARHACRRVRDERVPVGGSGPTALKVTSSSTVTFRLDARLGSRLSSTRKRSARENQLTRCAHSRGVIHSRSA